MLILNAPEAIRHAITFCTDAVPVETLGRYVEMLETEPIAWLFIVQPGDSAELLEKVRRQPFASWEYIDQSEGWFEAVFIISDDGYGHVVLLRDQPGSDPELLEMCRTFATTGE